MNTTCLFTRRYHVGVDEEQDEEDEFGQEDDQQNDEELKTRHIKRVQHEQKHAGYHTCCIHINAKQTNMTLLLKNINFSY